MRRTCDFFVLALLVATAATSETVQAVDADSGLYLHTTGDGWEVRQPASAPVRISRSPSELRPYQVVATADGWLVAGSAPRGDRHDLLILHYSKGRLERLPWLPDQIGRVRLHPVLSVEDDRLLGVVWVEGDRQEEFAIRSAVWQGSEWGPIEEVSRGAQGAQLALTSTVLAEGDWLVVWSAFDGEDDEIVWSRRLGEGWTRPRRLHADNRVPDITPTLVATASGAIVAWSVYDGDDYRLRLAHFDGTRWSASPLRGAKGSLDPQALARGGRYLVLHRTVIPDGWSLVELDEDGAVAQQAAVGLQGVERPLILPTGDAGVEVAWPGAEAGHPLASSRPDWEVVP